MWYSHNDNLNIGSQNKQKGAFRQMSGKASLRSYKRPKMSTEIKVLTFCSNLTTSKLVNIGRLSLMCD